MDNTEIKTEPITVKGWLSTATAIDNGRDKKVTIITYFDPKHWNTMVRFDKYNPVVFTVERYDEDEAADEGHKRWVKWALDNTREHMIAHLYRMHNRSEGE